MAHVEDLWWTKDPHTKQRVRRARYGQGRRWRAVWSEPNGRRASRTFEAKDEAVDFLASLTVQKADGSYVSRRAGQMTVEEYYRQWTQRQVGLSPTTLDTDEWAWTRYILPRWGHTSLRELTREDISEWINGLDHLAVTSKERVLEPFGRMLNAAVMARRIGVNPAAGTLRAAPSGKLSSRQQALSPEQLEALVDEIAEHWRDYTRFLAYTGLRQSEAAALTVADVDLRRRTVLVNKGLVIVRGKRVDRDTTKTHSSRREVPLIRQVLPIVERAIEGKAHSDRLFTGPRGGAIDRNTYNRRHFRPACQRLGLTVSPHGLRKTAVSYAIASGATILEVQRIAGHSRPSTTLDIYGHLLDPTAQGAAERMSNWLDSQTETPRMNSTSQRRHEEKARRRALRSSANTRRTPTAD